MNSLRRRFTLWSLGATAVMAVLAGASLYFYVRAVLYHEFDAGLRTRAQLIGSLLRIEDNGSYGMDYSDESMPEYLPGRRPEYFQVILANGTTLDRSESLKGGNLADGNVERGEAWNMALPDGRKGRAMAIRAFPQADSDDHDRPDRHPPAEKIDRVPAIVIVARERQSINSALEPLLSALMVAGLVLAAGSIFVVRFAVGQALKPVNELGQRAQEVGPGNLDYRFDVEALPTELRLIGERLNELLARLDQAFARERRLNADIAHELRTPIAELRSLTEVAKQWPTDPDQAAVYFDDAHAISLKMGAMVDSLLALARGRNPSDAKADENVGVATVVEQSLAAFRERIDQRVLQVSLAIPESCFVTTQRLIFGRIVENIISNAAEYASEGGRIECSAEVRGNECWLTIGNSNDSLNPADVQQIFDAFWRKDASRSDSEHVGLGLALVAEYARQLGIQISAHLPSGEWFEIVLRIPAGSTRKPLLNGTRPAAAQA